MAENQMNKGMATHSNTVYMFCNHPFELPCYAGIANVIREVRPEMENILILDSMPYFRKTDVSFCFNYFDKVHRVGYCDYQAGAWATAILGIAKGFASAYRFSRQLRAIEIKPNSFVFLISGRQLVSNVLLKRLKTLNPTLVYITQRHTESIDNYTFSYKRSLLANLYHLFFGASFVDYLYLRGYDYWPYIQHRRDPYHHTFYTRAPGASFPDNPDDIPFPFYFPERQQKVSQSTVVLFGSVFKHWHEIDLDKFVPRFNEIIQHIRMKHAGSKLIYKPHPSETNERELLDLHGFVIDESLTSELMFMKDPSIETIYSIASTASRTAPCFGIRAYVLFPLFDLSATLRKKREAFFHDVAPEAIIRSLDDLNNRGADARPAPDYLPVVRSGIVNMLERIGLLVE
jgi:hypothetical protein